MGKIETIVPIILFNLFFLLFIFGILIFIHQYKLKKKEHLMLLNHKEEEHKQELLTTQLEIQVQTMEHIGREIHDNIGQKLTLASLYTQQLSYENKAPHISENIESISQLINNSLSELRELSKSLTSNSIESLTLIELIEQECLKINALQICQVQFIYKLETNNLNYQIKSISLRIIQEFLQNSIKHSKCKNITIDLYFKEKLMYFILKDDGIGFNSTKLNTKGIGLNNIKKRIEIIGGTYTLESKTEEGTQVTLIIPIKE